MMMMMKMKMKMMILLPPSFCIFLLCFSSLFSSSSSSSLINASFNLTLPHQHPNPELVAREVHRRVKESVSRRRLLPVENDPCLTGNPIDDCWRCDPGWENNRQHLADCGIGFGHGAMGGKGGPIYTVSDPSDLDVVNPRPGTLRYAVIQTDPLWIVFAADMTITLKHELIFNSYKTVDGRGADVLITGNGCLTLPNITNVIIHNVQINNCKPSGNTLIRTSPTHSEYRGHSDGDGITVRASSNIWIDHCTLSSCTDGLIDVTRASTAVTISNSHFSNHDKVMLLGHVDTYVADVGMQVTVAFNHFGVGCVQRMPRCRRGYVHVVNNDYTEWKMYAIGGSAGPTINSQGNRYIAPDDNESKQVTKRVDTPDSEWIAWNWRTEGDMLVNGAFFVPSGEDLSNEYIKASSLDSHSVLFIENLTMHSGVLPLGRISTPGAYGGGTPPLGNNDDNNNNASPSGGNQDDTPFQVPFGGGAPPSPPPIAATLFLLSLLITLYL